MIITCPECQTRFRLPAERLKLGGARVRCAVCRAVFPVLPPQPPPLVILPDTPEEAADASFAEAPEAAGDWLTEEWTAGRGAAEAADEAAGSVAGLFAGPVEDTEPTEPAESDVTVEAAGPGHPEGPVQTTRPDPAIEPAEPAWPAPSAEPDQAAEPSAVAQTAPASRRSSPWPALLLLALLAAVAAFLFLTPDGRQLAEALRERLAGTMDDLPAEQRINLEVAGSSYVEHAEAGQLLVIQGTVSNRSGETRSALTVKGVILNADGRVIQQQTVFCGNSLAGEELQGMSYAQIEEAMNNQFGRGLSNLNVRNGATLPFTIVFRNVSPEMARINVEVGQSRAGDGT